MLADKIRKGAMMADSPPVTPNETGQELKQIESQMVSLNFVIKNTQSEVIKLQKTLARYQSRQDEIEKRQELLERDLARYINNQKQDETFRNRFWFYQLATLLLSVLLMMILNSLFFRPAPVVTTTNTTSESSRVDIEADSAENVSSP